MKIQVNVTTKVNSQQIRRETYNGRDHLVLPSYTLPANVIMNGGLYLASEIDAHYKGLEGTLAPLGHPTVDGKFVSAFSPEGINVGHIGAFNRNVKKSGNRIYLEKWVDVEVAGRTDGGQRLIDRVEALERGDDVPPIHTSVAVFANEGPVTEEQRAAGAEWVARITGMDHDAILLDDVGAATPEQGVGLMVNADKASALKSNSGALIGESYRERERRLDAAAKERFAPGNDQYAWVADFTDTQAIVVVSGGAAEVYGYKTEGGSVVFDNTGTPVVRTESWVAMVANSLAKGAARIKDKFLNPQARPATNQKEGEMPLTAEEKAELTKIAGEAAAAAATQAIQANTAAITDQLTKLQANQQALADQLTANAKAEEAEKRKAVADKYGDVVANSLQGEALDAMHKTLGTAATLAPNASQQQGQGLTADVNNLPKE